MNRLSVVASGRTEWRDDMGATGWRISLMYVVLSWREHGVLADTLYNECIPQQVASEAQSLP